MRKTKHLKGLHYLLIKTGEGDTDAFANLIDNIRESAMALIRAQSSDFDEAYVGAIFNHAMTIVWEKSPGFIGKAENDEGAEKVAWVWLETVIRNRSKRVADEISKRRRREISLDDPVTDHIEGSFIDHYVDDNRTPEKIIEDKQNIMQLEKSLDLQEHRVFRMLAEGFKQKDIAADLNLTEARVSQLVKSIRGKARPILGIY